MKTPTSEFAAPCPPCRPRTSSKSSTCWDGVSKCGSFAFGGVSNSGNVLQFISHIFTCFHSKNKASNRMGQVNELDMYVYIHIYIYIYTSYPPANSCPDVSFRIEQRSRNHSRHEALTSGLANARSRHQPAGPLWAGQKLR